VHQSFDRKQWVKMILTYSTYSSNHFFSIWLRCRFQLAEGSQKIVQSQYVFIVAEMEPMPWQTIILNVHQVRNGMGDGILRNKNAHQKTLWFWNMHTHSNFEGCLHVCDGQIHLASVWWSPCRESKWCLLQCTYFVVYPVEGICNLRMHMIFHKDSIFCVLFPMAYTRRYI
jgi:hypothetical protein